MDWSRPDFVIIIVVVCTMGWLVNNWIRARHGYALEDEWGGKTERADSQAMVDLRRENTALQARLEALEHRAAAIETIVTNQGYDVSRQIEGLRAGRHEVVTQ